jgi:hypothetical protein
MLVEQFAHRLSLDADAQNNSNHAVFLGVK